MEDLAGQTRWCAIQCFRRSQERHAIGWLPFPFALGQKAKGRRESVGIESGLNLENLDATIKQHFAHAPVALVQFAAMLIHETAGMNHGFRIVVMAQRFV